ncbi:MAG: flagellar hook assembly protein FlgD [Variibacter sp.]
MTTVSSTTQTSAAGSTATNPTMIAQNFDTFLQLLTTQLKNQNPLDPLDTNQFTQQLVQFAGVEQQMAMNSSLTTLISLQQTNQTTSSLGLLGATVTIAGDTAKLSQGVASWTFTTPTAGTATISVKGPSGETAYSGTYTFDAGGQKFTWDGVGNDGKTWPDGTYTISVVGKDSLGQDIAISTETTGVVDAIDVKQNPPVLTIGQQNFTIDQVKKINRAGI